MGPIREKGPAEWQNSEAIIWSDDRNGKRLWSEDQGVQS